VKCCQCKKPDNLAASDDENEENTYAEKSKENKLFEALQRMETTLISVKTNQERLQESVKLLSKQYYDIKEDQKKAQKEVQ